MLEGGLQRGEIDGLTDKTIKAELVNFRHKQVNEVSRLDKIAAAEELKNAKSSMNSPTEPESKQKRISESYSCRMFQEARLKHLVSCKAYEAALKSLKNLSSLEKF